MSRHNKKSGTGARASSGQYVRIVLAIAAVITAIGTIIVGLSDAWSRIYIARLPIRATEVAAVHTMSATATQTTSPSTTQTESVLDPAMPAASPTSTMVFPRPQPSPLVTPSPVPTASSTPLVPSPTLEAASTACSSGQIVFASDRDGDFEIYSMNPDGSHQRQLTQNNDRDLLPRLSPDGTRIGFVSNRDGQGDLHDIYVVDVDGRNLQQLTNEGAEDLAWSPDGKYIAFTSNRAGNFEIYVMNADGTNPRRLTFNRVWDNRPAWSPDSTKLAYSSRRSGSDDRGPWDIRVIDLDGRNDVEVITNRSRNIRPAWSPDGKQIAYATDLHGGWELYLKDVDGKQPAARLTNDGADDVEVVWSLDGRCFAFVTERSGDREIWTMDTKGGHLKNLTKHSESIDMYPFWSP